MIAHIFPYKLYTRGFINFIRMEYPFEEHILFVYGKCPNENFKIHEDGNVFKVESPDELFKMARYKKIVEQAEKIIIHSNDILITKMFMKKNQWIKKAYIVFWGFDIYCFRNNPVGIKNIVYRWIQKRQIRNAKGLCFLAEKDALELGKYVKNIKGRQYKAVYMIDPNEDAVLSARTTDKSTEPYKIVVGNSASQTNHHKEILGKLAKFKNENMAIYCPLSYGNKEYAGKVIAYGRSIFGEKFIPLCELMPLEQYRSFLNDCSIGFFNNDRQQAMGNINMLLGYGAKVFLRTDTPMWSLYTTQGYDVYDIGEVDRYSFQELICRSPEKVEQNYEIYKASVSIHEKKKMWDSIFDS